MPFTEGTTERGWGVVRCKPWHFVGLFPTQELAEAKAKELGSTYEAINGEHQVGTSNFIWTNLTAP
jgi:hypothetical protein